MLGSGSGEQGLQKSELGHFLPAGMLAGFGSLTSVLDTSFINLMSEKDSKQSKKMNDVIIILERNILNYKELSFPLLQTCINGT